MTHRGVDSEPAEPSSTIPRGAQRAAEKEPTGRTTSLTHELFRLEGVLYGTSVSRMQRECGLPFKNKRDN
jgi:hypothetical protein